MNRSQSLAAVAASYVVATAAAAAAYLAWPEGSLVQRVVLADVVGTVVIFLASVRFNNSSLYDAYWSVAPMLIAPWLMFVGWGEAEPVRQLLAVSVVTWWGWRLTYNWARGWTGMQHEDWRYVDIRAKTGPLYWLVSFLGIHLFPTLLVLAGCAGLVPALTTAGRPLGLLDALALLVASTGVLFELFADRQLHAFRARKPAPDEILSDGLWAWSRHPNYFGEITFWFGVALFGLAADPDAWWVAVGPAAMVLLFTFVSLPLIETRMLRKRPHFAEHKKKVPILIPWPPRR